MRVSLEEIIYQLAYESENHVHSDEKWFGVAGTPSATHKGDRITLNPASFQLDAGNDDWGAWVQLLGTADTPVATGNTYYDIHRLILTAYEVNTAVYAIQFADGPSAGLAAKLAAEDMTDVLVTTGTGIALSGPVDLQHDRIAAGQELWARALCKGQNTATINFYIGLHEYLR